MPNAFTSTTQVSNAVQTAYDRYFELGLRSQPMFRLVADKRPVQQTAPGTSVVFQLYSDLAEATSTLTETTDPDSVAISNTSTVTVTLAEYGNAILVTRKLNLFSLSDVDPALANMLAYNMAASVDTVVQTVLRAGSNVIREVSGAISTGAITGLTSTDTFKSKHVRYVVAKLRAANVVPRVDNLYWSAIHPEVSHDLRAETGAGGWRDAHIYAAPDVIWPALIGQYEGAFFMESPRCYNAVDGGAGGNTIRAFRTYFAGQQALAEAVSEEFHTMAGPVVDKLMRHRPSANTKPGGRKTSSDQWGTLRREPSPSRPLGRAGAETKRRGCRKADAIVRSCANTKRKRWAEMTHPKLLAA